MEKVLIVATVFKFLTFEINDMRILKEMGYEIHSATNMNESEWLKDDGTLDYLDIKKHQIDFGRSPFSKQSLIAYKQLKQLLHKEHYALIHFHTPVAAAIGRIASVQTRKQGTKIIYTCHGFHFHKKSFKRNWIMYYPIERWLAHLTDMIITINKEDYSVIQKFKVPEKRYIPGVGVDCASISSLKVDKNKMRKELKIPENAFVLLCIGELSARKNQEVVIKALAELKDPDVYLILCGGGEREQEYRELIEHFHLEQNILMLGQKEHDWLMKLCHVVDVGVIPSIIEGLGLAGLEIMSAGKPLIGSGVHGIKDYLVDQETGIVADPMKPSDYVAAIKKLKNSMGLYCLIAKNTVNMSKNFDIEKSAILMKYNYMKIMEKKDEI